MYCTWVGMSLFVPLPLLIFGILCMMAGIYVLVWTQHTTVVASMVTLAGAACVPFIVGDFLLAGRGTDVGISSFA
jgi:hypothetical protein